MHDSQGVGGDGASVFRCRRHSGVVRMRSAGHTLDVSSVELNASDTTVLLPGGLGRPDDLLMRAPAPIACADYAVVESTYGHRLHDTHDAGAAVRAQLSENGVVGAAPKYLIPMRLDRQASYGQLFLTIRSGSGPHRFRVLVKLPGRASAIEFAVSAWAPHRETR